jgi:hypothetical protein
MFVFVTNMCLKYQFSYGLLGNDSKKISQGLFVRNESPITHKFLHIREIK